MTGLGLGLMTISSTLMVSDCFEKRRGFAIALSVAGGGLGFVVFPVMVSMLVSHYGLQGALLVCSALYLNGILFGVVYRQMPNQSQKTGKVSVCFCFSRGPLCGPRKQVKRLCVFVLAGAHFGISKTFE
jgi:MFS family permease